MKLRPKLKSAGFNISTDGAGHISWAANSEVHRRSARFTAIQTESLNSLALNLPTAMCLVLYDGVRPSDLSDLIEQSARPEKTNDGLHIEWQNTDTNRLERRLLSPISELNWKRSDPVLHGPLVHYFSALGPNCIEDLTQFLASSQAYRNLKKPLLELELDLLSCLYFILPAQLFAHCSGLFPMAVLPLSALARRDLRLPAKRIQSVDIEECDQGATAELIDASLTSQGEDKHSGSSTLPSTFFQNGHLKLME